MPDKRNKTLSLSDDVVERLKEYENQSATVEQALREYWKPDLDELLERYREDDDRPPVDAEANRLLHHFVEWCEQQEGSDDE